MGGPIVDSIGLFFFLSFFFVLAFGVLGLGLGVSIHYFQGGVSNVWDQRQYGAWGVGVLRVCVFVPAPPPFSSLTPAGEAGGSNRRCNWGSGT